MISEFEARERVLANVPGPSVREVALAEALSEFSAAEVTATVAMPGFDNSSMDGYAVRTEDCAAQGARLQIAGCQPAGLDLGLKMSKGEAIRIFTGAPMPSGADAVVMQEETEAEDDFVIINTTVAAGEFIRHLGSDLCIGQRILSKGDQVTSARIGLLASQGLATLVVGSRPRVCVISTGDELASPDDSLSAGQIYNSNGPMLEAMVRECGIPDVSRRHLMDNIEETVSAISEEIARGGVIIISGGVSVGDRDFVQEALKQNGVDPDFWRVRVKPGKPLLFGFSQRSDSPALVFGLPGNPVSSFVTFALFVRPALMKWAGAAERYWSLPSIECESGGDYSNDADRPHYIRGSLEDGEGEGVVFVAAALQESHGLTSLASSNALLRVEPMEHISTGARIRVLLTAPHHQI